MERRYDRGEYSNKLEKDNSEMEENPDEKATEEDDPTGGKNSREGTDDTNNNDLDEPTGALQ